MDTPRLKITRKYDHLCGFHLQGHANHKILTEKPHREATKSKKFSQKILKVVSFILFQTGREFQSYDFGFRR